MVTYEQLHSAKPHETISSARPLWEPQISYHRLDNSVTFIWHTGTEYEDTASLRDVVDIYPLQWQPTSDTLTGYISSRPMACTSGCFYSCWYSWWWRQKEPETCTV